MNILILSDGRMGHLNQSIALAKHLKASYEIVPVRFTCKMCKALSYVLDFLHLYKTSLFQLEKALPNHFDAVLSAGSNTYYATKTIAKHYHVKSIVMMLPQSYRYDFDTIFAQSHDHPPKQDNIIELPANFSFCEPKGFFTPAQKSVGIIIGGNNAHFTMRREHLKKQLDLIFGHFQDYIIAVTTSPRTPKEIEALLQSYPFSYRVIFSHNPINPIADFLHHCDVVFITMDSTSMISEAISYGTSSIEVLPLDESRNSKFYTMAKTLEKEDYLHIFDGNICLKNKKIDFQYYAHKAFA
ncbi:MAG: ELM1/GtrOC1 family putative glycosyltransferase [Sulfurospirillaceae bacterium]|nr:ELM1/GtrOC1 family putative glycosyltransferase [Sulfurospirillaceae bacterium]